MPDTNPEQTGTEYPPFPIADAHVHLWDLGHLPYRWLGGVAKLNRDFLLADLDEARGPVDVGAIIFVQAEVDRPHALDEAKWVASLREDDPRIRAIVPFAQLDKGGAVRPDLEALAAVPGVVGIRQIISFEPGLDFCLRPGFLAGLHLLPEFGMTFDINVTEGHLPNVIEMVDRSPDNRFVLDHLGGPPIREGRMDPWASGLARLAERPNVWCKISGAATAADYDTWTEEQLRPYIGHAIDCFGWERVMFGSDWPVATLATTYQRWVRALWDIVHDEPEARQRAVFHDNAVRFYQRGPTG